MLAHPDGGVRAYVIFKVATPRFLSQFPCLRIFPGNIDGVIEVQNQALPAVQKTESEYVVVDERKLRPDNNIEKIKTPVSARDRNLRST